MRAIFTATAVAGLGLLAAACGSQTTTTTSNATTTEVTATENGAEDSMMGGMDGATGNAVVIENTASSVTSNTN
jgi:hypothetical protein